MVQTSQTQTADPWSVQQPFLERGFERAEDWYSNQQPQFFPGQTFTDLAPQQDLALQLTENRALTGSPIQGLGRQQYMDTLGGAYTAAGNPYLSNVAESIANRVQPQVQSRFAAGGRSGSGAEASEANRILADAIAPYAFNDYARERGIQNASMMAAPQYAQADYQDFDRLGAVGSAYRGQEDLRLSDAINRYNFGQNQPYTGLAQYMGLLGGTYGGTTDSTGTQPYHDPYRQDPFQNLLGAGSLGLAAYSAFSDRRLKTNIKRVGALDNGAGVYTYRYHNDLPDTVRMGVLADELEAVLPNAVFEVDGFKAVNYGAL